MKKQTLKLMIEVVIIVFLIELLIMFLLDYLPVIPNVIILALVDSILLALGTGPFIYFFTIRPFVVKIKTQQDLLVKLSTYDMLTNLPNRRLMNEYLDKTINEYERTNQLGALLFFDINKFKYVNDTYGHAFGDEVLRHIASQLKKSLRVHEFISRISGDEFVAILNLQTNDAMEAKGKAVIAAKRILFFASQSFNLSNGIKYKPSLCVGISLIPEHGNNKNDLLHNADISMYEIKKKKNRNIGVWNENNIEFPLT